jgi:hypothetical protein
VRRSRGCDSHPTHVSNTAPDVVVAVGVRDENRLHGHSRQKRATLKLNNAVLVHGGALPAQQLSTRGDTLTHATQTAVVHVLTGK